MWEALNSTCMRCLRIVFRSNVINERIHNNRQRNYFSKNVYSKAHKLILKSNSRNKNLARGSVHASKIGWAHGKNYSTQISNQGAQADLKMYKTSKIKYTQIRNFLNKNYLKIPKKLCYLMAFHIMPSAPIGPDEKFRVFWIPRRKIFKKKSLPLSSWRKLSIRLKLLFPSVCFSGVFLTLKCEPLVLFTIAASLSSLTFEDFCLGLTFSLGPRDPKRFSRAE